MFVEKSFLPAVPQKKVIEKKEKPPSIAEWLDFVVENSIDGEGNVSGLGFNAPRLLAEHPDWDGGKLEYAGDKVALVSVLLKKIKDGLETDLRKVVYLEYLSQLAESSRAREAVRDAMVNLKDEADEPNTTLFQKVVIHSALLENENTAELGVLGEEELERANEDAVFGLRSYHRRALNRRRLVLDKNMRDKLTADAWQAGNQAIVGIEPSEAVRNEYGRAYLSGAYLLCPAARGAFGLYSNRGQLVGWQTQEEAMNFSEMELAIRPLDLRNDTELDHQLPLHLRENEIPLFKLMSSLPFRLEIKKELGIELGHYSWRVQKQLLDFICRTKNADLPRLRNFFAVENGEEKRSRVISFLSLEQERSLGGGLLALSESLKESAQPIFDKYEEIVNAAEEAAAYLREDFLKQPEVSPAAIDELVDLLLRRGKELLSEFVKKTRANETLDCGAIARRLELVRTDILLFTQAFRAVKPSLAEIKNAEFYSLNQADLPSADREAMLDICARNYAGSGQLGIRIYEKFRLSLEQDRHKYFLLKHHGRLAAFMKIAPDDLRGRKQARSLNLSPDYEGAGLGLELLREVAGEQTGPVDGLVRTNREIGTRYVEELGFNIIGLSEEAKAGEPELFKLLFDKEKNRTFESRRIEREELIRALATPREVAELLRADSGERLLGDLLDQDILVFKFSNSDESTMARVVRLVLANGFVGTRYFVDEEDTNLRYYGFERDVSAKGKLSRAA